MAISNRRTETDSALQDSKPKNSTNQQDSHNNVAVAQVGILTEGNLALLRRSATPTTLYPMQVPAAFCFFSV